MANKEKPKERPLPMTTEGRWLLWGPFVICPLLFFTDLTRNPYYTQIALLNIFICVYWMLSVFQGLRRGEWVWTWTALDGPLLALVAVCFISWGASFVWHPAFRLSIYSEGSRAIIFVIVNVYLGYAAAVRSQDQAFVAKWVGVFYATAAFAAIYGLSQYFGVEWFWPHNLNPYGNRPVSTFGNPNFLSSYLLLALSVLFADFVGGLTKTPKLFLAVPLLACAGALLATLTRSSWAGALVGFLFVFPFAVAEGQKRPVLRNWLVTLAIITGLGIVFWPKGPSNGYSTTVLERLAEVRHTNEGTVQAVSQRFLIWVCSWQMVLDHPFLGTGFGCLELFYPFFQGTHLLDPLFRGFRTHANNSHNEIMEYWSQTGTVGLGLVILIWVTFFMVARTLGRRAQGPWRPFHWGLVGGVAGMLVDNLLNVSVHFAVPAFTFWWIVGTVFALDPAARELKRVPLERPWVRSLLIAAQVILLLFIVRAGCLWAEEVDFFQGFKYSKGGALPQAQEALEKAYGWHHGDVNMAYELANVYARSNQPDKAMLFFQRALDANAGYDEIYFNRATVSAQLGRTADAIADYRIAIAINPLSHDAYNALAGLYVKDLPQYSTATFKLYEQGVRAFPQDKEMWNNLGYIQTQRTDWGGAYESYKRALVIDPDFELAWKNLRQVAPHVPESANDPFAKQAAIFQEADRDLAAKNFEQGLKALEPLRQTMAQSFRLHFYLGNMYYGLNRFEDAIEQFKEASKLRPEVASLWQNLGASLERTGRIPEAKDAFNHALSLDPKNEGLRQHVSQLH